MTFIIVPSWTMNMNIDKNLYHCLVMNMNKGDTVHHCPVMDMKRELSSSIMSLSSEQPCNTISYTLHRKKIWFSLLNFFNCASCSSVDKLGKDYITLKSYIICLFIRQRWCSNGITNSSRITLPLLLRNKSQTCAKKQVLRKKIQHAMYTAD